MIQNMRDLGGIPAADGRTVRYGMLIRSAQLSEALEQDLSGVSAVIDLRTPEERLQAPDLVYGREYLPLPLFDGRTAGISRERGEEDQGFPDMAVLYQRLMLECAPAFRRVILAVMTHDFASGAVLWHCTEGKDRCGMTTALILEALGVRREDILEDYLKTNLVNLPKAARIRDRLAPVRGQAFADSVYRAYIADERYLRSAWEVMGENYLRDSLRIGDSLIEAFRRKALE